jgi:hypothetical protein
LVVGLSQTCVGVSLLNSIALSKRMARADHSLYNGVRHANLANPASASATDTRRPMFDTNEVSCELADLRGDPFWSAS